MAIAVCGDEPRTWEAAAAGGHHDAPHPSRSPANQNGISSLLGADPKDAFQFQLVTVLKRIGNDVKKEEQVWVEREYFERRRGASSQEDETITHKASCPVALAGLCQKLTLSGRSGVGKSKCLPSRR